MKYQVFLVALAASATEAQICNPYYTHFFDSAAPTAVQSSVARSFCPDITSTCCTDEDFVNMQTKYEAERSYVLKSANLVDDGGDLIITNTKAVADLLKEVSECALTNNTYVQLVNDAFAEILSFVDTSFNTFTNETVKCISKGLEYSAGASCFSCNNDMQMYYNSSLNLKIQLTENVCNEIKTECLPLYGSIKGFYEKMIAFLENSEFREFLEEDVFDYSLLDDMKTYVAELDTESNDICDFMFDDENPYKFDIARVEINEDLVQLVKLFDLNKLTSLVTCEGLTAIKESITDAIERGSELYQQIKERFSRRDVNVVEMVNDEDIHTFITKHIFTGYLQSMSDKAREMNIAHRRRRRSIGSNADNFGAEGYDATAQGSNSEFKTSVQIDEVDNKASGAQISSVLFASLLVITLALF